MNPFKKTNKKPSTSGSSSMAASSSSVINPPVPPRDDIQQQLDENSKKIEKDEVAILELEKELKLLEQKVLNGSATDAEKTVYNNKSDHLKAKQARLQTLTEIQRDLTKQQAEQQSEKLQTKSFHIDGLPPLGTQRASESGPSESDNHDEANFVEKEFKIIDFNTNGLKHSGAIWARFHANEMKNWGSENQIQSLVCSVLHDAITALNLGESLQCYPELPVFHLRADVWVVHNQYGIAIGVVEVKRPDLTVFESKKVAGQAFDNILRLQSFHGIHHPFCIVTTYNQWRVYWLEKSDKYASETTFVPIPEVSILDVIDKENILPQDNGESEVTVENYIVPQRMLSCSKIYDWNDKNIVPFIASIISRMNQSPISHHKLISNDRPYILVKQDGWYWRKVNWKSTTKLKLSKVPNKNTKSFILIKDFHGGKDGRVWLAATKSGFACVLKFARDQTNGEAVSKREAEKWQKIYDCNDARAIKLANYWATLMPYFEPVNKFDKRLKQKITDAHARLAEKNVVHKDLVARHVAYTPARGHVVFLDLTDVECDSENTDSCRKNLEDLFKELDI